MRVHLIGGADVAAELDAKRAIKQGTELAMASRRRHPPLPCSPNQLPASPASAPAILKIAPFCFDTLRIGLDGQVATMTLNRPDKANAMNLQMWQDLRAAMQWVDRTPRHAWRCCTAPAPTSAPASTCR
jgi:2,4-dienoyl-CoA reductase (NADPH2)